MGKGGFGEFGTSWDSALMTDRYERLGVGPGADTSRWELRHVLACDASAHDDLHSFSLPCLLIRPLAMAFNADGSQPSLIIE